MRLNYVGHRQEVFENSDDSIFVSYLFLPYAATRLNVLSLQSLTLFILIDISPRLLSSLNSVAKMFWPLAYRLYRHVAMQDFTCRRLGA